MQQLSGLENSLSTLFKGLPHLPKDWRHWLADNAWWLALIGVAFGCLGILGLVPVVLGISIFTGIVAGPAAGALIIITGIVNMAVLVISVTLEAMAITSLRVKQKRGWDLLFLVSLVTFTGAVLNALITGNVNHIIGLIVGTLIGLYVLFEVRMYFVHK
jgi:hypothetical protein